MSFTGITRGFISKENETTSFDHALRSVRKLPFPAGVTISWPLSKMEYFSHQPGILKRKMRSAAGAEAMRNVMSPRNG